MREEGTVVQAGEILRVRFERSGACEKCGQCGMTDAQKEIVIEARNDARAEVGDRVYVDMPADKVWRASLLAYVLPLIALIIGVSLDGPARSLLGLSMKDGVMGSLLGLLLAALSFAFLRPVERRIRHNLNWLPVASEIVRKKSEEFGVNEDGE